MHHVRTVVRQFPEKLKLQSIYTWLDEKEADLGASAKARVDRCLESADEDYENKIRQIVEDTAKKVQINHLTLFCGLALFFFCIN